MGIVFKLIMYVFGFVGLLLAISLVSVYLLLHTKVVDEKTFVEHLQRYTKVNFSVACKSSEPKEAATSIQKPHNIWLIENLDSEQAAKSLLSLSNDEIVKYLITIEREKSLKILEGMYTILEEQGDIGKKRKQDIDKKMLGGIK